MVVQAGHAALVPVAALPAGQTHLRVPPWTKRCPGPGLVASKQDRWTWRHSLTADTVGPTTGARSSILRDTAGTTLASSLAWNFPAGSTHHVNLYGKPVADLAGIPSSARSCDCSTVTSRTGCTTTSPVRAHTSRSFESRSAGPSPHTSTYSRRLTTGTIARWCKGGSDWRSSSRRTGPKSEGIDRHAHGDSPSATDDHAVAQAQDNLSNSSSWGSPIDSSKPSCSSGGRCGCGCRST